MVESNNTHKFGIDWSLTNFIAKGTHCTIQSGSKHINLRWTWRSLRKTSCVVMEKFEKWGTTLQFAWGQRVEILMMTQKASVSPTHQSCDEQTWWRRCERRLLCSVCSLAISPPLLTTIGQKFFRDAGSGMINGPHRNQFSATNCPHCTLSVTAMLIGAINQKQVEEFYDPGRLAPGTELIKFLYLLARLINKTAAFRVN